MKQELSQIYDEVSKGKLSQREALRKIKLIKLQGGNTTTGRLMAIPVWRGRGLDAVGVESGAVYREHHVMVCECGIWGEEQLRGLLPQSQSVLFVEGRGKTVAQRYSECAVICLERMQTMFRSKEQGKALLQVVVPDEKEGRILAGLTGLLRTGMRENPQFVGQLIMVADGMKAEELGRRLEEEKRQGQDGTIRYGTGGRGLLCWEEVDEGEEEESGIGFREEGVYLITGGLGGLGMLFAEEILEQTRAGRIVLTGRGAVCGEKQEKLERLSGGKGRGRVSYRPVDLRASGGVKALMAWIQKKYGKLSGILHGAGMITDNFILKKTATEFSAVLEPKVIGTYHLDQASQEMELDFFVLFSSIASAMGNIGQCDYAAANGFLDQFAAYRNQLVRIGQRHGRTRSINWPLWQDGGMKVETAIQEGVRARTGLEALQRNTGMRGFYRSLGMRCDQVLVAEGDLSRMRLTLFGNHPLYPEPSANPIAVEPRRASAVLDAEIGQDDLVERTRSYLRRQCSEVLKLPFQKIDPEATLEQYGIDSILAMKLTSHLEKTFGPLSKTLFFEYQTIHELTQYFTQSHSGQLATLFAASDNGHRLNQKAGETADLHALAEPELIANDVIRRRRRVVAEGRREAESIAIIGLSGRYPEAVNLKSYWENLRAGKDCITEVPGERWDWRRYFSEDRNRDGHHYSKWGGFIAGVEEFDPLFFNISPREAKYMDPQERLFLEHVWMAIEDAGYTRSSLQGSVKEELAGQVGVYAGVMYSEYQLFGAEASARGKGVGIPGSVASIANRASYVLNLHGPSMTVDTMCSSSLTSIHLACQDLKQGRTSLAIAGGVNVTIHPNKYLVLSVGQFISSEGHCQSFGEGGDGYVPGEGVGVVVLKRMSEAKRDGDHIYGIIRGSALNHGGKTNGYSVPNPQAQRDAIRRALAEAGVEARQISYIEAHGTGTKLGDPIEISALSQAFAQDTAEKGFCRIGSAKSNIGHCESAAGIAGLTKVLLQMQHQELVPSLHTERLNPHIDFEGSPFVVNRELRRWEQPVIEGRRLPRVAGISSFGAGGSNAHLIVEEYRGEGAQTAWEMRPAVIVLSARTGEQLRQKAQDLLAFVRVQQEQIDLGAMAYTLQVGREGMEERLGMTVRSVKEVAGKLESYLEGKAEIENVYEGQIRKHREVLGLFGSDNDLRQVTERWMENGKYDKLVELWVKGLEVEWSKLYGEVKPQRMSLPTYPFARERYWIETAARGKAAVNGTGNGRLAPEVLHPLLHRNTSDLSQQSYSTTLSGDEFFLKDQQCEHPRVFPEAVYLEMARAAIEQACPTRPELAVLELHNLVWAQPIVVSENQQVSIALWANEQHQEQIDYEIYSSEGEQETVHCQGQAVWNNQPATARLDVERLREEMGSEQRLAPLRLPRAMKDTWGDYVLHPSLMDGALQACVGLMEGEGSNQPRVPFALALLRIVSRCSPEMLVWVRYAPGSLAGERVVKLDLDLCDEQGDVAVQMRGVTWQPLDVDIAAPLGDHVTSAVVISAPRKEIPSAAPNPKEIAIWGCQQATSLQEVRKKSRAIVLAVPSVFATTISSEDRIPASADRALIRLSSTTCRVSVQGSEGPVASLVRLFDEGQGIFSIQIQIASSLGGGAAPAGSMIAEVLKALGRLQQEESVKVLLLRGVERCFPGDGRAGHNEAVAQGFYRTLVAFPYPVIAVLKESVIGASFLAAALCDLMVLNEDASYGYTDAQSYLYPTTAEAILFGERFGDVLAQDLLFVSMAATGKQLRNKGWTCPIMPEPQVDACAQRLAGTLVAKPQEALRLLKQNLMRRLVGLVTALTSVEIGAVEDRFGEVAETIASPCVHLHLESPSEHVLIIKLGLVNQQVGMKDLLADLSLILAKAHHVGYKAIVLVSKDSEFLAGADCTGEDVVLKFQRLVMESEIPIVAALQGNAKGRAWLMGQLCDVCVYNEKGVYSAAGMGVSELLGQTTTVLFKRRLGDSAGREILGSGADYSGMDLRQRAGTLLVAECDQVVPMAIRVAQGWAKLPCRTLAAWKKQAAMSLGEKTASLLAGTGWEEKAKDKAKDKAADLLPTEPTAIPLNSKVIAATAYPEGIVVVKMEDREAKNMFSHELIDGVREAFAYIEDTTAYKVVILTGYDSYFASGGTKESLLAIQAGYAKFTDNKIYQAASECKLPVIAAMQGHGIGAGWCLGMFADVVLLSEESQYVSPYMNYGFTPGAGATYILAEKMGQDLARESLLTGEAYSGRELKERGLKLAILPRAEVEGAAMRLARQMARAGRGQLMGLKQQWNQDAHERLEETYQLELALHEKTFVGQTETLAQIEKKFYPGGGTSPAQAPQPTSRQPGQVKGAAKPVTDSSDVQASLKILLANELQMPQGDIDENAQFIDLGLDSISGVTWVRKINEKYGTAIEATKVYSYPTLNQLSLYVQEQAEKQGTLSHPQTAPGVEMLVASGSKSSMSPVIAAKQAERKLTSWRKRRVQRFTSAVPARASATPTFPPIAVIGMTGQFPQARNLEEYWQNLAQGRNCITQVAAERWDVNTHYQPGKVVAGKSNSQWLGALEQYDRFDPSFFNISPTEAESMDPQQRLFLQACWHSIEHAGYDARALSGSKCGVFVGCATGHYQQLSRRHQLSAQGFTGNAMSILAARIAYVLNLQGPCISIDTACSSSLVAIAHACDSLNAGASDVALAGGVYVMAGPEMHIMTSQAGMLSPEGRCYSFDQRANGIVPGEAVGVVVLKRLADAQRDQDMIYGVIQGWGVNQDGKTNGITAPNQESQTRLEQEVYDKYQIDPGNIQLIEAHGTATKLGDPIEVEGLKKAFSMYTQKKGYCALGSVKSNIGHCLTAAGIAGFIKLLLALKHKQLPPTINFEQLNEHIELEGSPFYVNTRLQEWELKGAERRQAAISSFGFSGTNAHVVIGEYVAVTQRQQPVSTVPPGAKVMVPLSARKPAQLKQKAQDLLDYVRKEAQTMDLIAMAHTLQVGREAMEERVGFLVSSAEQLAEKLEAYIKGAPRTEDVYQGQVKRSRDGTSILSMDEEMRESVVDKWIGQRKLFKLLELWVQGLELNWNKLYGEIKPQRISLPAYPFAKERYWIGAAAGAAAEAEKDVLHPLVHANLSDLTGQRYLTTFSGEEFFVRDHQVRAEGGGMQRVLPEVAYLEMARAAIDLAWPIRSESMVLELRNVVWAEPIVITASQQISIALSVDDEDQIDYQIYSQDREEEIIHGQGRAVWSQGLPAQLNLEQLQGEMKQGRVEPDNVYKAFALMGLHYGPTHQAITALHLGEKQVLARLRLPAGVETSQETYRLHPSLMDSALQASVGLMVDLAHPPNKPSLPLALESLRIVSPCTSEMFAWVRYSTGSHAGDKVIKLDIDLCDEHGNVCVQMHGFSTRLFGKETPAVVGQDEAIGRLLAVPIWQESSLELSAAASNSAYTEHYVIVCELPHVRVEKLETLLAPTQCLWLQAVENNIAQRYSDYALACFEQVQSVLRGKPQGRVLVQVVVPYHGEQALLAGLSGLLKTAALENPQLTGQLILTLAETTAEELAKRLQEEKTGRLDPLIRYGHGIRQVLRWQEVAQAGEKAEEENKSPIAFKDEGVYLITGGLGGLGLRFTGEILTETRQPRVVLTGRSALSKEKQARLERLSGPDGRVTYRQLDLGNLEQVQQLIAGIQQEYGQLNGILHSAGMLADNLILEKGSAEFWKVLEPKVTGTYNLDQASRDMELDFFVLFSSVASVMGNPRIADYAAANGFMDQFAAYRNRQVADGQRYGRTRAINWPVWQAGGMEIKIATQRRLQKATGMQLMRTTTGMDAFHRSLALPCDQMLVVEGIRSKITSYYLEKTPILNSASNTETTSLYQHASATTEVTISQLQQQLKIILATVLRMDPSIIDLDQPFAELGLDSFLGAEMATAINKEYCIELSSMRLFDYPTVRGLSLFLEQELQKLSNDFKQAFAVPTVDPLLPAVTPHVSLKSKSRPGRMTTRSHVSADNRIAIIGMSGRYPKANNLQEYWNNLVEGMSSIVEVPASRWDINRYYDPNHSANNKTNSKWIGALDDVDCFDPLFFRISPKEADYIDPHHRLFLQESYKAFEDAGYSCDTLTNKKCGVYLGISTNEYAVLLSKHGALAAAPVTSNHCAVAAARIAYYLNLKGPAISVDTACSSSLVAIHLACQGLLNGETDMALAGGVTLILTPESYVAMTQAGMLSPAGRCKAFEDTADGIVVGEGVGALVLKRLKDAQDDKDFIYGVILGSGMNQDGRTNGITAPSVNSQIELERTIYARHKIDPGTITCVEAHGTGTKLGDPIELEALGTVFREKTSKKNYCALGSVKSNIGHTISAAGVASVQKVLLSMQHRTLVPTLHVTRENPHFDFKNSPFYISRESKPWDVAPGSLRRAAVSSFGFSGTNAHLVMEEYPALAEQAVHLGERTPVIVPLSARTAEQLRQRSRDLLEFIRTARPSVNLAAMAYTLQIGREAMEQRLGFVVGSMDQLADKLSAYLDGQKNIPDVYQGHIEMGEGSAILGGDSDLQELVDKWIAHKKLSKVLDLWVRGLNFDWNKLYGSVKPRRISLPTYPFAKERYWIQEISLAQDPANQYKADQTMKSIEDLINSIGDDVIETDEAVKALKQLV
jgi:acyl transferase domain-containing protein/enoyl-CoA hydratase/carnithine racemase/acyl carrier protein